MYLRIFCNEQQNDWARWLPIAQYALNSRPSTTKIPPYKFLIGVIPKAYFSETEGGNLETLKEQLKELEKRAYNAIL
jgi:hypothetical protein